jgi:hypothetical protein
MASTVEYTATGIKCGNCHHYHPTVSQVRACHQGAQPDALSQAAANLASNTGPVVQASPPASKKQKDFLRILLAERGRDEVWITNRIAGLSMGQASDLISFTMQTPKATETIAAPKLLAPKVPSGRYAIYVDGVVKFFKVDCPTEGQWAGRTFVKIQASDELYPVRGETAKAVLVLIAEDPEAASKLYGRELGHCGICGRTLTDETSRANGIGPICAEKAGW